jgi:hypothetical protein
LELPVAGWTKAPGASGQAEAEILLPAGGPVEIEDLLITAPGLDLDASLQLGRQPLSLQQVDLRQGVIGEQQLTGRLRRTDGRLQVEIRGEHLALDPVLDAIDPGGLGGGDDGGPSTPMSLDLAVDQLSLNKRALSQFQLTANRTIHRWQKADLSGVLDSGGRLAATLAPGQDGQAVTVTSEDAGGLIELLSARHPIAGGRLRLEGELRQRPSLEFAGRLGIDEFTIDQAPILARMLTLLSAKGIGDVLTGRQLAMTRLEIPFHLTGDRLNLERSRTWGSGLGLTMEGAANLEAETLDLKGTVLPAYGLNWAIGKIPVLGDFLAGKQGEGAFAATYSVRGPFAEPQVRVNPLSVLAPGFLRDLFGGEGEAPTMPPDRDLSR